MTSFLIILLVIIILVLSYALWGRAWLLKQWWAQGFFRWVEPIESVLFKKSETLLVGRLTWFGGLLVTAYDAVAQFATSLDLTPITARVMHDIPEDMRPLVVTGLITAIGFAISWMRKRVTKPIEIVALPIDSPPNVAAAADQATAANQQAVATAKAEGVA